MLTGKLAHLGLYSEHYCMPQCGAFLYLVKREAWYMLKISDTNKDMNMNIIFEKNIVVDTGTAMDTKFDATFDKNVNAQERPCRHVEHTTKKKTMGPIVVRKMGAAEQAFDV
ncbi:hypothetical protein ACJX0J_008128, partial [Zea mays]